jgi:hypothetical protein
MPTLATDLWSLVQGRPQIDPGDLARAIQEQITSGDLDYRTRWLIHDGLAALERYWGRSRLDSWLQNCPVRQQLEAIRADTFERIGFPSLGRRLMEKTEPKDILQLLRDVGSSLHHTTKVYIGGSVALILGQYLARKTEDIDVVDEVPQEIRTDYNLIDRLEKVYGLHLAHFQSHYLPNGWQERAHSLEPFGRLQVFLVDVYDVFLSKLFSKRDKDLMDLRVLEPQLDKETLTRRLRDTTVSWLSDPKLVSHAEKNWQILYGEALPQ